jgi:hypothetical protein
MQESYEFYIFCIASLGAPSPRPPLGNAMHERAFARAAQQVWSGLDPFTSRFCATGRVYCGLGLMGGEELWRRFGLVASLAPEALARVLGRLWSCGGLMMVNLRESGLDGGGAISSDLVRWLAARRISMPFSGSNAILDALLVMFFTRVQFDGFEGSL